MANLKCSILTSDRKEEFKDAFKHARSFSDYDLTQHSESVYFANTKSPYLFWSHADYPLVLAGDGRKTNLSKIGKFTGGMDEVIEALDVMTFLLTRENAYILHLDPHTKDLYRTMVPKIRKVQVTKELKGLKTMSELEDLREVKRKEYEAKKADAEAEVEA